MKHALSPLSICLVVCFIGCQQDLPSDLPKLYSCKVTVSIDGTPTEGVAVTFSPSDGAKWPAMGTTGPDGSVSLTTNGRFPGVAAGQYKIILYKDSVEVVGETVKETLLIGQSYTSAATTPLEYTMETKASTVEFDAKSR